MVKGVFNKKRGSRRSTKDSTVLAAEFGKRLRAAREERGLSQRDLAERLHTGASQVSRYENGTQLPNVETLMALAGILHMDVSELLLGQKSGTSSDDIGIKDVRLLERVRELEKLDRQARDAAVMLLEAIIVQGNQRALTERLVATR
jgi:transcriptional regulator with XRE-family HTH domain